MDTFLNDFKVRIDLPDEKGRTPFLNFYQSPPGGDQENIYAYQLLKMGANVNQMDSSGMYALKYAMIRRIDSQIIKLVREFKANVN